ncbi:MAG: class II aldolase/adducin family protein [Burkholderiaceae bacterium]|nr:class II aldolase/adducin family protein [Burkholderiaceae bacterium]
MVAALAQLDARGMNRGSTGNLSHRAGDGQGCWITPTGMGAADTGADDLVWLALDGGTAQRRANRWKPSSEAPFHLALYAARPDLHAVVHCHSAHATALACLRRALPPFHYMVAVAGGGAVAGAAGHPVGPEALGRAGGAALHERGACLLSNHGLVAAGRTLAQAMKVALEVESLCEVYLKALAVGEPALLDAAQMAEVAARFRGYGQAATAPRVGEG